MCKFSKGLVLFTILAMLATPIMVSANNNNIRVVVNEQEIHFPDQAPVIIDGRTLVPVRGVFEALGWSVEWHYETSSVLMSDSNEFFNIAIEIGADTFSVGVFNPDMPWGHAAIGVLDVPAQIIGGRTMLPLRAVLESVGYSLDWDETTSTVYIISNALNQTGLPTPPIYYRNPLDRAVVDVDDLIDIPIYFAE